MTEFPIAAVREQFPALAGTFNGHPRIHLDNPAGTQVPLRVARAAADCLLYTNANLGGFFESSQAAGFIAEQAHRDAATLFGAADWQEIVLGTSMTALTFMLARAIGTMLSPGDEIIVTRMDHEGNVSPWLRMAEARGCIVRVLPFDQESWRIEPATLSGLLGPRTRLLALNYASNLTGSINDVAALCAMAKQAGTLVYVDAVQFAPHGLLDVAALGCDFCAATAYKFYGPHLGVLWGRRDLLQSLPAEKVRPLKDELPWRWEPGTPQIELNAALSAAVDYIAWLGGEAPIKRAQIAAAWAASSAWEDTLQRRLITGLQALPGVTIHGITNPNRMAFRVPTVSFTHARTAPAVIAGALAKRGICVWSGNNYALEVVRQLGIDEATGVLRIGMAQYNTPEEVDAVLQAVEDVLF